MMSWNPVDHSYGKVKHTGKSQRNILNAPFFHAEAPSLLSSVSSHAPAEQQQEELTCSCNCQVKTVGNFSTTSQEMRLK